MNRLLSFFALITIFHTNPMISHPLATNWWRGEMGNTFLHYPRINAQGAQKVVAEGLNPMTRNWNQETPLRSALARSEWALINKQTHPEDPVAANQADQADQDVIIIADILDNWRDEHGMNAMHYVQTCQDIQDLDENTVLSVKDPATKSYIDRGQIREERRHTPLHIAVIDGNVPLVHCFIEKYHVPVNIEGQRMMTPLLLAVATGNKELITYLLSQGADPTRVDATGLDILTHAIGADAGPKFPQWLREQLGEDIISKIKAQRLQIKSFLKGGN